MSVGITRKYTKEKIFECTKTALLSISHQNDVEYLIQFDMDNQTSQFQ
jgi:hypothetical protein